MPAFVRLHPVFGACHSGDAHRRSPGIHAANVLLDDLWLCSSGRNTGWVGDECWHGVIVSWNYGVRTTPSRWRSAMSADAVV